VVLEEFKRIAPPDDMESRRARLQPDDVVVCITGARTGAVAHVRELSEAAYINQHVCLLRPTSDRIAGRYLAYTLSSAKGQEQLKLAMYGLKQGLGLDDVGNQLVCLPPLKEQSRVIEYLDRVLARYEALVEEAERAIALLQEHGAALISAAVTGKIDVRRPETRTQPVRQADRIRVRMIVAAEIMERLSQKAKFGRVKLQKLAYLAETHANVNELQGNYLREAAGPLDRDMIEEMEARLRGDGFVSIEQPGGRGGTVTYRVKRRGAYREEAAAMLSSRATRLKRLIDLLGDLDTKSVEAIATLYAVWNDALLDRITPTDDFIIGVLLNDWHPEKAEKFKPTDLRKWLEWMRRHELTPNGTGPRTATGRLFA
jgi:type I restriction enzyme S subunit